jgi:hypothetical protein
MGTGSFPGVATGRGVMLTLHPLLVPWSEYRVGLSIPLLSLRAFMACKKGEIYLLWKIPEVVACYNLVNGVNPVYI